MESREWRLYCPVCELQLSEWRPGLYTWVGEGIPLFIYILDDPTSYIYHPALPVGPPYHNMPCLCKLTTCLSTKLLLFSSNSDHSVDDK